MGRCNERIERCNGRALGTMMVSVWVREVKWLRMVGAWVRCMSVMGGLEVAIMRADMYGWYVCGHDV